MTADGELGDELDEESAHLLMGIRDLYTEVDPMPIHLVDRARFAVDLEHLELDLARRNPELASAGRGHDEVRHVTFEAERVTIMIAIDATDADLWQFDGWLMPAAIYRIQLRTRHGIQVAQSDERGRFAIDAVPSGEVQLIVHVGDAAVTTPVIVL